MREEIRIRYKQIMGINPAHAPGQGENEKTMGNDPRNMHQAPWRIGDLVSLMICANFKKLVNNSYIKYEYVDELHKSMRADIIFKNVINETILHIDDEAKGDFSDVYDPGLLWLAAPYYVKTYGYDIIPELNWDDDEYDGPDLPKGEYIIFCPLTDAQYNLERNMSQELVESMCLKLKEKFGDSLYVIVNPNNEKLVDSNNINRIISDRIYDLAYIIAHSKCFIGGDTGFSHLAGSSRLKQQICLGWPKQRIEKFNYSDWPWFFINPFSLQGQFMNHTWDMYPQVDKSVTDYHEFLLENNTLSEAQIDKLITIIE